MNNNSINFFVKGTVIQTPKNKK